MILLLLRVRVEWNVSHVLPRAEFGIIFKISDGDLMQCNLIL